MPSANLRLILVTLALAAVSGAGGYALYQQMHQNPADQSAEVDLKPAPPEIRPEFALSDLDGKSRNIREWDGKVLLINFWATWCPPCQREIPAFIELQEKYTERGLQIVGVAIDERGAVQDFANTMGINYPILAGEQEAIDVAKQYGNRFGALPYSAIVDRQGRIVSIQQGELTQEAVEKIIAPLL